VRDKGCDKGIKKKRVLQKDYRIKEVISVQTNASDFKQKPFTQWEEILLDNSEAQQHRWLQTGIVSSQNPQDTFFIH
jgi:hypothetical protein